MYIVGAGDTSNVLYVKLRDSTTGFAKTGLVFNSAGAAASYTRPLAAAISITLASQTVTGAWTSGGFVEVDATKCPGLYRLDIPDGAVASGADYVLIAITFSGVLAEVFEVVIDPMPDVPVATVQADAGNSTTTFKTDLTSATDDFYKDSWFTFRTGNLANQTKKISAYNGATKIITVSTPYTATPNNGSIGVVVNR